ncbi:beta-lactamase family protein [Streptomyces sp. AV19]|uniref:serine hydrolase domain-containing protein n=1 Tax=Streptomyces sp. AV19 TaxID=2793068 RepID=UPI0018FE7D41|nr:serine hydrolase domain-containing protein [Streptomyces sp. AV19]MBH1933857.1 beta-lactamase family protein [Streptomyces sp. AV19]MDG4535655.1 beta-lactamase family protein [Streptomyces sp. AV19]
MLRRTTPVMAALLATATLTPTVTATAAEQPTHGTQLQHTLDALVAAGAPSAVAEVRDGDTVHRLASGLADPGAHDPARPADRFRAGSVTKSFVATVVLQLVAEHRIGLDDPIGRHLPGLVPDGTDGAPVTVRQLLDHTSGIHNYTDEYRGNLATSLRGAQRDHRTPREVIAEALRAPRKFTPGAPGAWEYSNTNYVVLALLIEKVTHHSLGREIDRRIVRPLRLRDTYVPTTDRLTGGRHLRGYEVFPKETAATDFTDFSPTFFWGPGSIVSTTADLNRFFRALSGGRLLPPHLWREMTTWHEMGGERKDRRYGLGLESNAGYCPGEEPVRGHTGSVPGYNTYSFTTADGRRQVTLAIGREFTKPDDANAAARKFLATALCSR